MERENHNDGSGLQKRVDTPCYFSLKALAHTVINPYFLQGSVEFVRYQYYRRLAASC